MKTLKYALKNEWYNVIALLLPFGIIPFISGYLPARMAMHWSLNGHASLYRSKNFGIFFLPVINFCLYVIILGQSGRDKTKNLFIRTSLVFLLLITQMINIAENMRWGYPPIDLILPITALLLIIGGFYFRFNQPNGFIGIHLAWSFEDPQKWHRSHRFATYLWIVLGTFLLTLFPFVNTHTLINIFWVTLLIVGLLPTFYSFYLYNFQNTSRSNSN